MSRQLALHSGQHPAVPGRACSVQRLLSQKWRMNFEMPIVPKSHGFNTQSTGKSVCLVYISSKRIFVLTLHVWQAEKSRDRKLASRHETGIQKVKSHANTSETNYAKHKVKNEEQAGACTDNGSMTVGSGARAGGMGRRVGHGGESAEEEEGHEFLGMLVEKDFAGFGTFRGLVRNLKTSATYSHIFNVCIHVVHHIASHHTHNYRKLYCLTFEDVVSFHLYCANTVPQILNFLEGICCS